MIIPGRVCWVISLLMSSVYACEPADFEYLSQLRELLQRFPEDSLAHETVGESTVLDQWIEEEQAPGEVKDLAISDAQWRFGCRTCGACFKNKVLQLAHQRETGHQVCKGYCKPFACFCGKRFALHNYLMRHQVTHTDERKYECDQCSQKFKLRDQLLWHLKRVHADRTYACDFPKCVMQFKNKRALTVHRYVHFPELKPQVCEYCGIRFTLKHSLRRHLKNQHDVLLPK